MPQCHSAFSHSGSPQRGEALLQEVEGYKAVIACDSEASSFGDRVVHGKRGRKQLIFSNIFYWKNHSYIIGKLKCRCRTLFLIQQIYPYSEQRNSLIDCLSVFKKEVHIWQTIDLIMLNQKYQYLSTMNYTMSSQQFYYLIMNFEKTENNTPASQDHQIIKQPGRQSLTTLLSESFQKVKDVEHICDLKNSISESGHKSQGQISPASRQKNDSTLDSEQSTKNRKVLSIDVITKLKHYLSTLKDTISKPVQREIIEKEAIKVIVQTQNYLDKQIELITHDHQNSQNIQKHQHQTQQEAKIKMLKKQLQKQKKKKEQIQQMNKTLEKSCTVIGNSKKNYQEQHVILQGIFQELLDFAKQKINQMNTSIPKHINQQQQSFISSISYRFFCISKKGNNQALLESQSQSNKSQSSIKVDSSICPQEKNNNPHQKQYHSQMHKPLNKVQEQPFQSILTEQDKTVSNTSQITKSQYDQTYKQAIDDYPYLKTTQ